MLGTRPSNYYEIHRAPGVEEKHTLYVQGIEGDMIAQYSRNDAILLNQVASNDWLVNPFMFEVWGEEWTTLAKNQQEQWTVELGLLPAEENFQGIKVMIWIRY